METTLFLAQILIAVVLVTIILLQVKGTSANIFGAAESSFRTRRGLEKILFQFTIFLIVLFIVLAILAAWRPWG